MKTNLTTKQIKKIQNGKLAIFKDIDTREAREYLLKVLGWLFPNDDDDDEGKQRAVELGLYFYAFCDTTWCHNDKQKFKSIPLSKIMYTYNPEKFKPISMPCTEEQWNNDLKPVVEAFWLETDISAPFRKYISVTKKGKVVDLYYNHYKELTTYSPTEFLEACGIVRVDKELEQTYTITTDQIKTARTNPETLEKIFPKVFEKPVVEVGRWYVGTADGYNYHYFIEQIKEHNRNGIKSYGFNSAQEWSNSEWRLTDLILNNSREATISDLQPLFEAEFNKRYKEGDLLESAYDKESKYKFSKDGIDFNYLFRDCSIRCYGWSLFESGNFAKVIKSAELIKAEEELEQAKRKVERLTNK